MFKQEKGPLQDSWVFVPSSSNNESSLQKDEDTDLDSLDPRWLTLFIEFFITEHAKDSDDLLFFIDSSDAVSGMVPSLFEFSLNP